MKTLQVTSPPQRGKDVKAAQSALKKSKYGSFYHGDLDGEWGPISANSTKDAKYYVGWESKSITPAYGDAIHKVLTGKTPLTEAQEKRRKDRLREPPIGGKRKKMLQIAVSRIGIKESPSGSNKCQFSAWYGVVGPWCAMFVTKCGNEAGLSAFQRGSRWAYCPYMVSDALAGRNGLRARGKSEAPQPGDIVLFDWGGDGVADHVGIFEKGTRNSFTCIEGNTAVGNDSNGGEVMRRQRSGSVRLFAYVTR
jgi:hypothetical protein